MPRTGGRGSRAGAALGAALTAALPLLAAGAASAAVPVARATAIAPSDAPVQVLVTRLEPRAPMSAAEPFEIAGRLVNTGPDPLSLVQLRLAVGGVLDSRSAMESADLQPPPTGNVGVPYDAAEPSLPPGASTTFDIRVPVGELGMSRLGVYPLQVRVRAVVGSEARRTTVGLASTYLPWFAGQAPARTRIAWLWPLVDQPRRGPRETMLDDELATELAPHGRLRTLLDAARDGSHAGCDPPAAPAPGKPPAPRSAPCRHDPVPVTYAVDPDLLFTADAMTRPYDIRDTDTRTHKGAGTAAARSWLDQLRAQTGPDRVLALPYADPDLVALSRHSALRDELPRLTRLGMTTATRVLDEPVLTGLAWPPPGRLTPATLDSLADAGASSLVLDEVALPPPAEDTGRTPGARTLLPATNLSVSGLVIDDTLSRLLQPDPATLPWQGARLAEQRWLAETAIIAAERPSESRSLLVAPPRRASLVPAFAAAVLADTGRLPWLCPVALVDLAVADEACPGEPRPGQPRRPEQRGPLVPPTDPTGELPGSYLNRVAAVRAQTDQLTENVLQPGQKQVDTNARLLRARARAESSAWRDAPRAGNRLLGLLVDDVNDLSGQVQVTASRKVTLTSDTGTIRVSVVNRLDQPVTVGVLLRASNEARLSTTRTPVVIVPPGVSQQISVTAHALTSGQFVVNAQLFDRDGHPFGTAAQFVVRSTHYGRVALAVTGLGAGVLLVAAGVRITRRALHK